MIELYYFTIEKPPGCDVTFAYIWRKGDDDKTAPPVKEFHSTRDDARRLVRMQAEAWIAHHSVPRRYCPVCGEEMRQARRGATLSKRGPAYICPADEAETWTDEDGRKHRRDAESRVHGAYVRVWEGSDSHD